MVEQDLSIDDEPGLDRERRTWRAAEPGQSRRLGDYRILREIGRGGMGVRVRGRAGQRWAAAWR